MATSPKASLSQQDRVRLASALAVQCKSYERSARFAPTPNLEEAYKKELGALKELQARIIDDNFEV